MPRDVSIAILCGGKSTRFGSDKAIHQVGGKPMYRHVFDKVSALSDDVFLQGGENVGLTAGHVNKDRYPDAGPLGGICSALDHASHERVFVVACDMPFLDVRILDELIMAGEADIVVPRWRDGKTEPLCAIYSKGVAGVARELLHSGRHKVAGLFAIAKRVGHVPIEPLIEGRRISRDCFVNINEPKDLLRPTSLEPRT